MASIRSMSGIAVEILGSWNVEIRDSFPDVSNLLFTQSMMSCSTRVFVDCWKISNYNTFTFPRNTLVVFNLFKIQKKSWKIRLHYSVLLFGLKQLLIIFQLSLSTRTWAARRLPTSRSGFPHKCLGRRCRPTSTSASDRGRRRSCSSQSSPWTFSFGWIFYKKTRAKMLPYILERLQNHSFSPSWTSFG